MRVLVYKRTHPHDPSDDGCFGIEDCMGKIRLRRFDAVIAVGGIGAEARRHDIDGKLNWVGLGTRRGRRFGRGPLITFDHFRDFGTTGESLRKIAPNLAARVYERRLRHLMTDSMTEAQRAEVREILERVRNAPPSSYKSRGGRSSRCVPRRRVCQRRSRC